MLQAVGLRMTHPGCQDLQKSLLAGTLGSASRTITQDLSHSLACGALGKVMTAVVLEVCVLRAEAWP